MDVKRIENHLKVAHKLTGEVYRQKLKEAICIDEKKEIISEECFDISASVMPSLNRRFDRRIYFKFYKISYLRVCNSK